MLGSIPCQFWGSQIGRVGTTEVMYIFWWDPMSDGWNAISYIFPQLGSNVVSKGEAVHCYVPNGSEKIFDHLLKRVHQVKMDLWLRAPQFGHVSWIHLRTKIFMNRAGVDFLFRHFSNWRTHLGNLCIPNTQNHAFNKISGSQRQTIYFKSSLRILKF